MGSLWEFPRTAVQTSAATAAGEQKKFFFTRSPPDYRTWGCAVEKWEGKAESAGEVRARRSEILNLDFRSQISGWGNEDLRYSSLREPPSPSNLKSHTSNFALPDLPHHRRLGSDALHAVTE